MLLERVGEDVVAKQTNVFGEHREQTTHQKARHELRRVPTLLKLLREICDPLRDLPRYLFGMSTRIEAQRVKPDCSEKVSVLRQIAKVQAVLLSVRKSTVRAGTVESGIDIEAETDVGDD